MKEKIVERTQQPVFWWKGLMFVPHLTIKDAFVGPGYGRHDVRYWSREQLVLLGAKEATHPLADPTVDLPDTLKKVKKNV